MSNKKLNVDEWDEKYRNSVQWKLPIMLATPNFASKSLCFWLVYSTLDAVYKVKAGFIMVLIGIVKTRQLALISYHIEN